MSDRFKLLFEVACNILEVLYNSVIDIARHFYGVKIPRVRVRPHASKGLSLTFDEKTPSETVDARIAKIEIARESLADAIAAVDELKGIAQENKRDLEYLTAQIQRAEANKANLSGELEALKGIAALDSEAVRKVLKLPTRVSIWTERIIAFLLGVIASTLASVLYEYVVKRFI